MRLWDHGQLSVYGVGAELSRDEWTSVLRQLIHHGYLRQDIAAYSALKLQPSARNVLRGGVGLRFARPRVWAGGSAGAGGGADGGGRGGKRAKRSRALGSGVDADGLPIDEELFERLRELRRTLAAEQQVPAYVVFADRSLADMAARKPASREELLGCHGVGQAKLERYGDAFLAAIAGE